MRTFRAGVIGCGELARTHTECLAKIEGLDMVAFCDRTEAKARRLLDEFGGEYATDDVNRLFADPTLDAIYITTHHDSHAEYCIRAMEGGKHVMVEKPLALTVADCLAVSAAVRKTGKKLMTAFKMRYYEMIRKAKTLIPQPLVVTMQIMDERWADDFWANDPVKGGGNVLSQGVHACDILRYMAGGEPVEVYAVGGNYYQKTGVIDNLAAVFRFDNGVTVNWVNGDCNRPPLPSKFYLQMFAENRSVTISDRLTTLTYSADGEEPVVFKGTESGFMEENVAFLESLRQDAAPPIDDIDGLYATLMVLQAFRSIESGKPEPVKELVQSLQERGHF